MVGRGLRALICVLVVTGCLLTVGPGAVAVADTGTATSTAIQEESPNEELTLDDADSIIIEIHLEENGNATVVADYQYRIGNDNTTDEEWNALEEDVVNSYLDEEEEQWQETLQAGENETEREMNISGFSVETDRSTTPREYGHVEFSFEWGSFAYVELNRLEAGDALTGFMLDDGTELHMIWPETYNITGADPEPDQRGDNSATWDGDSAGSDSQPPQIELIDEGTATDEPAPDDDDGVLPVDGVVDALALVVIAIVATVSGWLLRRDGDDTPPTPDEPAEPTDSAAAGSGQVTMPPPDLLSNEERVMRLLEKRGGRLKQQQVVSELEWTEAKTSQVVSGLREDDEIDVFRIGRENVLTLPEEGDEETFSE